MSERKWTPAPLQVVPGDSRLFILSEDGRELASVGLVHYWQRFTEEDRANAHLFAAAPALVEALEAVARDFEWDNGGCALCGSDSRHVAHSATAHEPWCAVPQA
jgi:hypothetical protein